MRDFTQGRKPDTADELWLVEHTPVYTLGQASKPEHLLNPGKIPVIQTDRGGQVTYHGPGQVMVYILADLKRSGRYIKQMVNEIEESVIITLGGSLVRLVPTVAYDAPGGSAEMFGLFFAGNGQHTGYASSSCLQQGRPSCHCGRFLCGRLLGSYVPCIF
jgi:hypothetical protein